MGDIESVFYKIGWYLLSMWLFMGIVLVLSVPIYIGPDMEFVGFKELWKHNGVLIIFSISILIFDLGFWFHLKYLWKGAKELSVEVIEIEARNGDALSFLASYFIPLVSFNVNQINHELVLLILFISIGVMYVRGNMFHQNPTLLLLGFKLYDAKIKQKSGKTFKITILANNNLEIQDYIRYRIITNKLWLVKKSSINKN